MSNQGLRFLRDWIEEHILAGDTDVELQNDVAAYTAKCLAEAVKEGISRSDIEDEAGSIERRMLGAMRGASEDKEFRSAPKNN